MSQRLNFEIDMLRSGVFPEAGSSFRRGDGREGNADSNDFAFLTVFLTIWLRFLCVWLFISSQINVFGHHQWSTSRHVSLDIRNHSDPWGERQECQEFWCPNLDPIRCSCGRKKKRHNLPSTAEHSVSLSIADSHPCCGYDIYIYVIIYIYIYIIIWYIIIIVICRFYMVLQAVWLVWTILDPALQIPQPWNSGFSQLTGMWWFAVSRTGFLKELLHL